MVFCHSFFLFFLKFKKSTKQATEMVGLLASNASHSITLLQLVEYYNRKKQKMKYRGISAVINEDHGVFWREGLNTSVKSKDFLVKNANGETLKDMIINELGTS